MSDLIFSDSFINGEFYKTASRFSVDDPATEQSIVDVSDIDEQGVNTAINAAKGAFVKLKATNATERSDTLMRWYELVIKHKQTLATLMTKEQGKPLKESLGESGNGTG